MELKHTPLYDLHEEVGAKLVPFAGYAMPVSYPQGIMKEHLHTREQASLFDVSHMGQILVEGQGEHDAASGLEALMPVDLDALEDYQQTYTLLTNEQGGIMDDLMITRWGPNRFFLIVNAACKDKDFEYLSANLPGLQVTMMDDRGLLALQGPKAKDVMSEFVPELDQLEFMRCREVEIDGIACHLSRSGYTGEDGFEISMPADKAVTLAKTLLAFDSVEAAGLGARDTLRMEAGLCLYGHELDEDTTPVEAGLRWAIGKSRRPGGVKAGGFPGASVILEQLENGVQRKRVGLTAEGRIPVREGAEIINRRDDVVGKVTSGGYVPSLSAPVAMGYVDTDEAVEGNRLKTVVRGKTQTMIIVKLPFVKQRYYRLSR